MLVLDEQEWVEEVLHDKRLGDKPGETLFRIAKYYYQDGYSREQVEQRLLEFLIKCAPATPPVKWSKRIETAAKYAEGQSMILVKSVDISSHEMDAIDSIKGVQAKRLAFTLLCIAKYYDQINENNNHWVPNHDNTIAKLANINTSLKRQCDLYNQLSESGFIELSKKVNSNNVRVCEVGGDEIVLSITDFRNLGFQYLMSMGEPFFKCENCGITTKRKDSKKGRKQKYCSECAPRIALKQRVDSIMKHREKKKDHPDVECTPHDSGKVENNYVFKPA